MFPSTGGGSRRCSVDGISYPNEFKFQTCPVCGEATSFVSNDTPDEDWQWKATLLLEQQEQAATPAPEIPTVDAAQVPVKFDSGAYWIHYWDLYWAGLRVKLQPLDLVRVGEQVFEVLEYVESLRQFLVRPFSLTLSQEELAQLSGQADVGT
jgi:hypothetical protein